MDYRFNYPELRQRVSTTLSGMSSRTKDRLKPLYEPALEDIKETKSFYMENAKYGWKRGRRMAKHHNLNPVSSLVYKIAHTIAKTKIRGKDVVPLVSCGLFSFSNPFVGMGIVGFALGQKFNTKILNGLKFLQKSVLKLKIK